MLRQKLYKRLKKNSLKAFKEVIMKAFLKYICIQYGIILFLFLLSFIGIFFSPHIKNEGYAGYSWSVLLQSTVLSMKLLGFGIFFSLVINSLSLALAFLSIRWKKEITHSLEMLFQIVSSIPIFLACLYLRKWGIHANILWGGFIIAAGDFLLAEFFPLLNTRINTIFHPTYRESLRGKGIFFPFPGHFFQ